MGNAQSYSKEFPNGETSGPALQKFLFRKCKADDGRQLPCVEYVVDTGGVGSLEVKQSNNQLMNKTTVGSLPHGTRFWGCHVVRIRDMDKYNEVMYVIKPYEGYIVYRYEPHVLGRGGFVASVGERQRFFRPVIEEGGGFDASANAKPHIVPYNSSPYPPPHLQATKEVPTVKADPSKLFTVVRELSHAKVYRMDSGNPKMRVVLRSGPHSSFPQLSSIHDGDTIITDARLSIRNHDGSDVEEWARITSPVFGYALLSLQHVDLTAINERSIKENTFFRLYGDERLAQSHFPILHVELMNYEVKRDENDYTLTLRDEPGDVKGGARTKIEANVVLAASAKVTVLGPDGQRADWLRIKSPLVGFVPYTLHKDCSESQVSKRAWAERTYFMPVQARTEAPSAPPVLPQRDQAHTLTQGPLPSVLFVAAECPVCFWERPEGVESHEGATNRDQGGVVLTIMCTLQCGHQLCSGCCEIISKSRPQCPICRAKMTPAELMRYVGTTAAEQQPTVDSPWSVEKARAMVGQKTV
eukprot:GILI01012204.1.p1 GENE.GILI01012204.1~~GILI01012204.1.p1  ORF type:complete len:527 (+),score=75.79 GILI01012204.1:49-1629(+)